MTIDRFANDNRPSLPEVVPDGQVQVRGEEKTYTVEQTDAGPAEIQRYTLNKAPVEFIERVIGTNRNEQQQTFSQGGDYRLSDDNTEIVWLDSADNLPQPGTKFFVTYVADAIISRYLDAVENELDTVEDELVEVVNNSFVNSATGESLDELGKLFGPEIGKRRGRSDKQYRIYLKSVVQSFVSRGTVTGIKLAIAAATDVPVEDITIQEDFQVNEYELQVIPNTQVSVQVLQDVADIADPSGVEQILTRFQLPAETISVADAVTKRGPTGETSDTLGATDSTRRPASIDTFEFAFTDDGVTIRGPAATTSDTSVSDDTVTTATQTIEWNDSQWNELTWATTQ